MAFEFGAFNEFSDSVTFADLVIAAVAKAINLGPWTGKFYEAMGAPAVTLATKKFELYSRTKTSRDGAIGAGGWDNDDTTGLAMTAAACKGLTKGHVLKVGDELVTVKSVDRTNNTIDVLKRGDAGTTAASHTGSTAFKVVGYAGNDTDLADVEGMHETTNVYTNAVQTIFEIINWTRHGELLRKGLSDAQAQAMLIKEAEVRVAETLANMAINGYKQIPTDDTARYMSAGLLQQLTDTNNNTRSPLTYAVAGALTEAKLLAGIKQVFDAGGNPDTLWVSPTVKGYINTFNIANSSLAINANKTDHGAGGQYIDHIDYEGNIIAVRVDRDMPNGNIALVTQADCKKGWLENDGLRMVDEPSKSSRETRKSLQGSVGFIVENVGSAHMLFTGITGGSTERITKVSVAGGVDVNEVAAPVATYAQITVNADSEVPAAAAANIGLRVKIGTGWTSGTKIATAVAGEVWASNGAAWVKQA